MRRFLTAVLGTPYGENAGNAEKLATKARRHKVRRQKTEVRSKLFATNEHEFFSHKKAQKAQRNFRHGFTQINTDFG